MARIHHWILIAVATSLAACSAGSDEATTLQATTLQATTLQATTLQAQQACQDYAQGSWRTRYLELGRETYEMACASCHDGGKDGTPIKGDRDSWSDRSPLWSAVLIEHAKSGYLEMPTKGGQIQLSDRAVEAAGEYMLHETFPERPQD
jgi:cytochrome c5